MMRSLRALAFCLILATVPLAGPAGAAAAEAEPSILSSDARLAKRVTLSAYRIHLGELLERLSAETGVPLATDERHSLISGRELAVVVHDRPAAEVLDAVARLYNFPPDRWYWAREKRGRRGLYVLHNTLSDAELIRRREEWALNTLLEEYHWKKGFLALPPGRRNLMAASNPALQGLNTSQFAGRFSFVGNLPENELLAILRGQPLSIPASAFSPAQRSALAADIAEGNTQRRQSFIHTEGQAEPLELRVEDLESVSLKRGDEVGGLPTLTFTMHMGNSQTITSLLGGWDLLGALREHTPDDWVATDETVTAEDQPVPPAGTRVHPADLQSEHNTADRLLERLGHVGRLNLLYDRPVSRHSRFYITLKKSLEGRLPQVLSSIRNDFVMWKRWDDFLLFRLADWSVDHTRVPVPWPVIRDLRAAARRNGGYLDLESWLRLGSLHPAQREHLQAEFNDVSTLAEPGDLTLILQLAAGMSEKERVLLAGPTGTGWTDWSERMQRRAIAMFGRQDARKMRLLLQWRMDKEPPRVEYYLRRADAEPEPVTTADIEPGRQAVHLYRVQPVQSTQYPPHGNRPVQ